MLEHGRPKREVLSQAEQIPDFIVESLDYENQTSLPMAKESQIQIQSPPLFRALMGVSACAGKEHRQKVGSPGLATAAAGPESPRFL